MEGRGKYVAAAVVFGLACVAVATFKSKKENKDDPPPFDYSLTTIQRDIDALKAINLPDPVEQAKAQADANLALMRQDTSKVKNDARKVNSLAGHDANVLQCQLDRQSTLANKV